MNTRELALTIAYIEHNWPNTPMRDERTEIYRLELEDLDFDEVQRVLRARFAKDDFPPTPMKLRWAAKEANAPRLPDPDEVYNELMDGIARVGYMQPEPDWTHPLIAEFVARRGGWREVCETTPSREIFDAASMSAAGTFKAQLRDDWKLLAARQQHEVSHAALGSPDQGELDQ